MISSILHRLLIFPFRVRLLKQENARLQAENLRLQSELQAALDLALRDAVTGAMSRHALDIELKRLGVDVQAMAGRRNRRHRRVECTVAILVLDLSGFKNVNDRFGHPVGDQALAAVVDAIRSAIRATDHLVFRVGGDEFVVVLEDVNCAEATIVARRIITNIEAIPDWKLTGRLGGAVWDVNVYPKAKPMDVYAFADMLERELRAQHQNGQVNVQSYEP